MRFDGKVGLVTGGGSGIGRAVAIGFARLGGKVAVADINRDSAATVAATIHAAGGAAIAIAADMTRPPEIEAMIAQTLDAFGRLDMLHNNAFGVPASLQKGRMAPVARVQHHGVNSPFARVQIGHRGARQHRQMRSRKRLAHGADSGQGHHRVTQPVGGAHHDPRHRRGIELHYLLSVKLWCGRVVRWRRNYFGN